MTVKSNLLNGKVRGSVFKRVDFDINNPLIKKEIECNISERRYLKGKKKLRLKEICIEIYQIKILYI